MSRKRWRSFAVAWTVASLMFCAVAAAADGDADTSFGEGGLALVASADDTVAIIPADAMTLPDGKLLFSGARHRLLPENPPFEPEIRAMLVRMNADGSADASFGDSSIPGLVVLPDLVPGTRIQTLESMTRLDDGTIVAVGAGVADSPSQGFVVKLDAEGALDTSFGNQGVVLLPDYSLHAVAIDSQGRIVACGEHLLDFHNTSALLRFDAGGTPDASFGDNGVVSIPWSDAEQAAYLSDVVLTADDGIVAGGRFAAYGPGVDSDFAIVRLAADGSFDASFGGGTGWRVFHDDADTSTANGIDRLALLADGGIVFAGYHGVGDGFRGFALGRLSADGASDPSFGDPATPGFLYVDSVPSARAIDASALAIQPDGKPVVSVTYFSATDEQQFFALRATADGQLDASFANGGLFEADLAGTDAMYSDVRSMTLQPDGRIVLGGRLVHTIDPPLTDMVVMRLLNDVAQPDEIFASGFDE